MIFAIIIACALVSLVHGLWALEAHMGDQDDPKTPRTGAQDRSRKDRTMIPFAKNPECDQGKHANCHGDAWDDYRDCLGVCECPCHYDLKDAS